MSFFEDASLVLIPSAQKTSKVYSVKPTDGTGDLTFTRSNDTATRVGPDGLIEKVRTNVILQSNTFNTTWGATNATVTSGATDPNGATTAWTLANTAASGIIQQAATLAGLRSVSIYAKAGTHRYLYMGAYVGSGTDSYQVFDLQDGVITNGSKGRIESVGNGWYRCTSFGADGTTGGVQIFPSNSSSGSASTNGNILIWRCQYESGDIATPYIATTSAAVSVGPVANVPRLDYLNSTCPKLQLEPSRTNVITYSEQLNNAAWIEATSGGTITVTPNYATSPSGLQDAERIQMTYSGGSAQYAQIYQPLSVTAGASYTVSVYLKSLSGTPTILLGNYAGSENTPVTLTTEWQRYTLTVVANASIFVKIALGFSFSSTSADILAWGYQVEAGAYATSYIPTLGAAVTRGADAASKTGISSLIGQTEGTLFVETTYNGAANSSQFNRIINITDGSLDNFIAVSKNSGTAELYVYSQVGGVPQVDSSAISNTNLIGTHKIAFAYKANDFVLYVDGVQRFTDTSGLVAACSQLNIGGIGALGGGADQLGGSVNQALLFKTRLSNSELAALTA